MLNGFIEECQQCSQKTWENPLWAMQLVALGAEYGVHDVWCENYMDTSNWEYLHHTGYQIKRWTLSLHSWLVFFLVEVFTLNSSQSRCCLSRDVDWSVGAHFPMQILESSGERGRGGSVSLEGWEEDELRATSCFPLSFLSRDLQCLSQP